MKRILSILLLCTLLVGISSNLVYASTTFKDVPSTHWASSAINTMADQGLFVGKSKNPDGSLNFCPDDIMSRAEFITVVIRAFYSKDLENPEIVQIPWWNAPYVISLRKGILENKDLDNGDMEKAMTRQEMAMVLARTVESQGEFFKGLINPIYIPDFDSIDEQYQEFVRKSYTKGLLAGVDNNGTFDPDGTLTRAQAATVLYRLIDKDSRIPVKSGMLIND